MSKSTTLTGMCVLVLILLSGAAIAAEVQNGLLVVNSTPSGATIYADGGNYHYHPVGYTTNSTVPLVPGNYTVYLELTGYMPWSSFDYLNADVQINSSEVTTLEQAGRPIVLSPIPVNQGSVIITSEPSGASLYIPQLLSGDIPIGKTPYTNGALAAPVTYSFTLKYPGYYDYTGTFTTVAGQVQHVYAAMIPIPTTGYVDFRTNPTGAELALNGTNYGPTNQVLSLNPGGYSYEFTLAGYFPANGTFTVNTSSTAENPLPIWRNLSQVPDIQTVMINSTPQGAWIYVDGTNQTKQTLNTVDMVRAIHTITLKKPCYKDKTFTVNLTQLPPGLFALETVILDPLSVQICQVLHGSIVPVGDPCVNYMQDKVYNVTADYGYHIANITFVNSTGTFTQAFTDGKTRTTLYTLPNVTNSGTLCAVMDSNVYNVTAVVTPAGDGFVQVMPVDGAWYDTIVTKNVTHGTAITFNIRNWDGYLFDSYIWNGVTTSLGAAVDSYSFNAGAIVNDGLLVVPFKVAEFQVNPVVFGNGTVTPSGIQRALRNGSVCFNATAGTDSYLLNVTAVGEDFILRPISPNAENKYCVTNITQNYTLVSVFAPFRVTIHRSMNEGGNITASPYPFGPDGNVTVNRNTTMTFNATPDDCHTLGSFTFNGVPVSSNYTVNATVNSTVAAVFTPKTVVVSPVLVPPAGTTTPVIFPSTNQTIVCGGFVVFNVTAPDCYHPNVTLSGASGTTVPTGVQNGQTWSYNLTNVREDKTFRAAFAINQYNLTINSTGPGSVTPSGVVLVPCGGNSTAISINPNPGYDYSTQVTGYAGGFPADGIFRNVRNDITLNVTFSAITTPVVDFIARNATSPYPVDPSGYHPVISDTNPVNRTVQFFDRTNATLYHPRTWNWNFGDGQTSILQNPVHEYQAVGTYTVSLTVGNGAAVPGYMAKTYYVIGDMTS